MPHCSATKALRCSYWLGCAAVGVFSFDLPKILSHPARYSGVETLEKWLIELCEADLGASLLLEESPELLAVCFTVFSAFALELSLFPLLCFISALLPLTFFVMINLLCSFCYIFSQLPNFDQLHKYRQQSIPKLQVYRCMEFLKVQ